MQKLASCIEHCDPDACVEEAARVAREMGVGAGELLKLSMETGLYSRYDFAYVIALVAAQGFEGEAKADAYFNAGLAAQYLKKVEKAEQHYKQAIEADPNLIEAHGAYGLFLIESDQRENSWKETNIASDLFQKALRFTESYLAKAWFYEEYSKKHLGQNEFYESSEDAYSAGQEYLKAADTTDDGSKEKSAFELRGNELNAKSYIRKEHKNPQELINNLKLASEYYKKASVCQVGGREEYVQHAEK